jgi:hypothetical protein
MQVAAAKMNVAPAEQWKAFINSLSSKGVKKDEIMLSGVLDWLDEASGVQAVEAAKRLTIGDYQEAQAAAGLSRIDDSLGNDVPILVEGLPVKRWLTERGVAGIIAIKVRNAILDARETSADDSSIDFAVARDRLRDGLGRSVTNEGVEAARGALGLVQRAYNEGKVRFSEITEITIDGQALTDFYPGADTAVIAAVERVLRDHRGTARPEQPTNWRDAELDLHRSNNSAVQSNSVILLKTIKNDVETRGLDLVFKTAEHGRPKEPGTAVATVEPDPKQWLAQKIAEAEAKVQKRIPKQAVLDYLAQNGVQVKTAILGAPKEEQEGFRKPAPTTLPAPITVDMEKFPHGYGADTTSEPGAIIVLAPNGDEYKAESGDVGMALLAAQAHAAQYRKLPALPDDYSYEINEEGQYVITTSDGEEITADTRDEAMEAIDETYKNNEGLPVEPSDEEVLEKARELAREDTQLRDEYVQGSDYANRSFEVAFRPPTFKIVKEEGSRGIVDMFTGRETPEHYRVVQLDFSEAALPADDDVTDSAGGNERNRHNMPDDADEFWEMFGDEAKQEPVGPEFATFAEAKAYAEGHLNLNDSPRWILWDSENIGRRGDPESDNIGVFDDWSELSSAAESERDSRAQNEAENFMNDIEDFFDDEWFEHHYGDEARRALTNNDEPSAWYSKSDYLGRLLPGWTRGRDRPEAYDPEEARLQLKHKGQYQSDGGTTTARS